ncbi:hypothetical protein [Rhodanobacter sp. C05]|uniref:hypothetical protein n=1 Tax=Rhodanobacter sp. C05 TaxID=1945855 RepID=UPI000985B40A|nr:hypothetical protein [Rhodanobacter sp. C05]OOG43649.1 hypothetical protein B0E51_02365 [Rhodanobacter sp. C05]
MRDARSAWPDPSADVIDRSSITADHSSRPIHRTSQSWRGEPRSTAGFLEPVGNEHSMETVMNPRSRVVATAAFFASIFCLAGSSACAESTAAYLSPNLKVGERLSDVFSKTVSIKGTGFNEKVDRISGSADYTVTGVTPEAFIFDEEGRYDGHPTHGVTHDIKILQDGITNCYKGKCAVDDETSGLTFNSLLWGKAPDDIRAGTTWTVTIPKPWEIGPAGTEQVRVVRVDPLNDVVALTRHGSGSGPSSDDQYRQQSGTPTQITTTAGKTIDVSVIPGQTTWRGYTTICKGVIVSDEIMVQRRVTLVSKGGDKFEGEQRSYTLLDLSQDTI